MVLCVHVELPTCTVLALIIRTVKKNYYHDRLALNRKQVNYPCGVFDCIRADKKWSDSWPWRRRVGHLNLDVLPWRRQDTRSVTNVHFQEIDHKLQSAALLDRGIYDNRRTGHSYGMTQWKANITVCFEYGSRMKQRMLPTTLLRPVKCPFDQRSFKQRTQLREGSRYGNSLLLMWTPCCL